jgi:hypothetical protein
MRSCCVTPDTSVMLESRDSTGLKHILEKKKGLVRRVLVHKTGEEQGLNYRIKALY